MVEPMLGVTLDPDDGSALAEDQRDPLARASCSVDCRVPPGLGEDARARAHRARCWATNGYELSFDETRGRQPLAGRLAADGRDRALDRARGPGRRGRARRCCPASPTRAGSATAFPDCVAYGFFPQRHMDLFEATPLMHGADERVRRARPRRSRRAFYAGLPEEVLR